MLVNSKISKIEIYLICHISYFYAFITNSIISLNNIEKVSSLIVILNVNQFYSILSILYVKFMLKK